MFGTESHKSLPSGHQLRQYATAGSTDGTTNNTILMITACSSAGGRQRKGSGRETRRFAFKGAVYLWAGWLTAAKLRAAVAADSSALGLAGVVLERARGSQCPGPLQKDPHTAAAQTSGGGRSREPASMDGLFKLDFKEEEIPSHRGRQSQMGFAIA